MALIAKVIATSLIAAFLLVFLNFKSKIRRRDCQPRQRGIKILKARPEDGIDIDIVAVHGLGADPENTWTCRRPQSTAPVPGSKTRKRAQFWMTQRIGDAIRGFSGRPTESCKKQSEGPLAAQGSRLHWLREFLAEDFPNARIMTFGYNADWCIRSPSVTACERAGTLLKDLKDLRSQTNRPVLFIAHSFGGIVVKEEELQYQEIHESTWGIVFLGTPHQGSFLAAIGAFVALMTTPFHGSNRLLPKVLQLHSTQLSDLQERFLNNYPRGKWLFCVRETIPTFWGGVSFGLIVDRNSAYILGREDPFLENEPLDKDHSGLNKCVDRQDPAYAFVSKAVRKTLEAATVLLDEQGRKEAENKRAEILTWLRPIVQTDLQESHFRRCARGTGQSFLRGPFAKWYTSTSSLLWLSGGVGSGKSLLCSMIVDDLQCRLGEKTGITGTDAALAYFYFVFDDSVTHDFANFIRSILAQLCPSYMNIPEIVQVFEATQPKAASIIELCEVLLLIIRNLASGTEKANAKTSHTRNPWKSLTIVLDALDEVPIPDRGGFLHFLDDLIALGSNRLRIVIVSREEEVFKYHLQKSQGWTWIDLGAPEVQSDILLFVQSEIEGHESLRRQSIQVKTKISQRISGEVDGMFRLAALQMQELKELDLEDGLDDFIDQILDELPPDLDKFYDRILGRVNHRLKGQLFDALKWLAFAARPLYIEELMHACHIKPDNAVPFQGKPLTGKEILRKLPGLVRLTPPFEPGSDSGLCGVHIIKLAHFSVQEYLAPVRNPGRQAGLCRFEAAIAHSYLARSCFVYLHHCTQQSDGHTNAYPLRAYAWYFWAFHLVAARGGSMIDPQTQISSLRLHNTVAFPLLYPSNDLNTLKQNDPIFATFLDMLQKQMSQASEDLLKVLRDPKFPYGAQKDDTERYFEYEPLRNCPGPIRLVILHPATEMSAPIECSLCSDSLENKAVYTALSYVWGGQPYQTQIRINGDCHDITPNLASALQAIRSTETPRTLWIDAISISMQDLPERSAQIVQMGQIFGSAREVLLWIGQETEESIMFVSFLKSKEKTPSRGGYYDHSLLKGNDDFFSRSVWRRAWMIQELACAANVIVQCGRDSITWEDLGEVELTESRILDSISPEKRVGVRRMLHDSHAGVATIQHLRRIFQAEGHVRLPELLYSSRYHVSSFHSDKVYALLGLLPARERTSTLLLPNYTLSVDEVYNRLAVYILKAYQSLDILSFVSFSGKYYEEKTATKSPRAWVIRALSPSEKAWSLWGSNDPVLHSLVFPETKLMPNSDIPRWHMDLPSWVPTWPSNLPQPLVAGVFVPSQAELFNAGWQHLKRPLQFSNDLKTLTTEGIRLKIGALQFFNLGLLYSHKCDCTQLLADDLAKEGLRARYSNKNKLLEACWRTLFADQRVCQDGRMARMRLTYALPPRTSSDEQTLREEIFRQDGGHFRYRKFFISKAGYVGLVPKYAIYDDVIVILQGAKVPFLLRPLGKLYALIGECYVHGVMDGEYLRLEHAEEQFEDFQLG